MIFRPGKRSSVPSKIRCESAIVVSSGLPMVLPSQPLPAKRLVSSGTPCGWMNRARRVPPPWPTPDGTWDRRIRRRRPRRRSRRPSAPASSPRSRAPARQGRAPARSARRRRRSGRALTAQSSASFSFWIFTICAARSRSLPYQNGLIDSTSMSTACASIAFEALVDLDEGLRRAIDRRSWTGCGIGAEQRAGFAEVAMRVHVDGLDASCR